MALVLQPTGNPTAFQHYNDTVENPVIISKPEIQDLLGPDYIQIMKIFNPDAFISKSDNMVPMWGIVPTKINRKKYEKLNAGDRVIFSRNKRIFRTGKVAYKFENYDLSKHLWGIDANGAAWSLMYAISDLEEIDISYSDFNAAVGYSENAIIQGFNVLSVSKSEAFETTFFPEKNSQLNLPKPSEWIMRCLYQFIIDCDGGDTAYAQQVADFINGHIELATIVSNEGIVEIREERLPSPLANDYVSQLVESHFRARTNTQIPSAQEMVPVAEEIIPLSSEGASSNGGMLQIFADGLPASCFINDTNPKKTIEILFEEEHSTFFDYFSELCKFLEPGKITWGNSRRTMSLFLRPSTGFESPTNHTSPPDRVFQHTITKNQLKKSSINVDKSKVEALESSGLIDFSSIEPGPDGKVMRPCTLLIGDKTELTQVSFSIPKRRVESSRENRLWVYGLKNLVSKQKKLYFRSNESMLYVSDSMSKILN